MKKSLIAQAAAKFIAGLLLVSALLFVPAGTIHYWNAWLFLGLLFIPMLALCVILLIKSPELLEKRLSAKEKEPEQRKVVALSALIFVVGFVVAALDYRFSWSRLPLPLVLAASALLLIAYALYAEVMRENAYLSRTVEVQKDQRVIDTGLYGIVRHPMYLATVLLYFAIPLVLGSAFSLLVFLSYPFVIVKRILNEEAVLEEGLTGYKEYERKVKYRLIPFIW